MHVTECDCQPLVGGQCSEGPFEQVVQLSLLDLCLGVPTSILKIGGILVVFDQVIQIGGGMTPPGTQPVVTAVGDDR